MNKIFLKILTLCIGLIDYSNKKKIINFLKKKLGRKSLEVIDIGSHKGETINLFLKNFNIDKIFGFEPNIQLFNLLTKKYNDKNVFLFNCGVGSTEEHRDLNIMIDSSSSTFNSINLDSNYYKKKK